ncbi:hypothetical protein BC831DRAFT_482144 [Entophlyctis helioformis]|nr:hypothetical protein BC831DRAFT_482144 [Entophlyctis helioformis]
MGYKDWLTYPTAQVVIIRDWRLGSMYYGLMLAIFGYIIYNAVTTGSYLQKVPPVAGSVRTTALLENTGIIPPSYCLPGQFNNGGCVFWNAEQIVFPFSGELNTIFVTTRVTFSRTVTPASIGCPNFFEAAAAIGCAPPSIKDPANTVLSFYVAFVEKLTIQLDHTIRAEFPQTFSESKFVKASTVEMKGKMLRGCSGGLDKVGANYDDGYHRPSPNVTRLDIFSVGDLIGNGTCDGSSFSLDGASNAPGAKDGESWRSAGFVVSFPIKYTNRENPSETNTFKYTYVPAIIDRAEFKIVQQINNADGSITYVNRHGIRVVFEQTGLIGQFDFLALVLNFVAATALLAVAAKIVDYAMIYALPNRDLYNHLKYEESVDLTDATAVAQAVSNARTVAENNSVNGPTSLITKSGTLGRSGISPRSAEQPASANANADANPPALAPPNIQYAASTASSKYSHSLNDAATAPSAPAMTYAPSSQQQVPTVAAVYSGAYYANVTDPSQQQQQQQQYVQQQQPQQYMQQYQQTQPQLQPQYTYQG